MIGGHPADDLYERIIRRLQVRTIPPLDAEVLSQSLADGSLELQLKAAPDVLKIWGVEGGYKGVPLAYDGAFVLKVSIGARVLLEFADSDVRKPFVRSVLSGTVTKATGPGGATGQPAARKTDPVRVTIPTGAVIVSVVAGVGASNPAPIPLDGTITDGSQKVEFG